jgi:hypothetical protein
MSDPMQQASPSSMPLIAVASGMVLALLVMGLYLWSLHGAAIFTDLVSAAIAWCF